MNIAVIGTGNVGSILGMRWAQHGHNVCFGTRNTDDPKIVKLLEASGASAKAESAEDAADESDIVVLAVPWTAAEETIESLGDLSGKILVDCTNPLNENMTGLTVDESTSAAEMIAQWAKGTKVVKAFNTTGSNNMADPIYGGDKTTMFICGDDDDAKQTVSSLAEELDFDVIDAGPLNTARSLEELAVLWIHLAFAQGWGPDFAIKVVKR